MYKIIKVCVLLSSTTISAKLKFNLIDFIFISAYTKGNYPRFSFLFFFFFVKHQVEAALSVSPYVDNIMVHVDPVQSFCVALVVASHQALENWASNQGISYSDISELCKMPEAIKEVQSTLVKVCAPYFLQFNCLASILVLFLLRFPLNMFVRDSHQIPSSCMQN